MKRTWRKTLLAVVMLAIVGPTFATDRLVPHTAVYRIKISIASGTLTTSVAEDGEGFRVHSVIEPKGWAGLFVHGTIEENSHFVATEEGILLMRYWSNDELSSHPKAMDFVFDHNAGVVSGTVNDERYSYPLDADVHDRVSIQYELMHNLMTGTPGTDYQLLDDDEMKQLKVSSIGRKKVKVPYGTFDAVGIRHQSENSKRVTTLWCAEELGYLPVLIEQSRNGEVKGRAVLAEYHAGMPGESAVSAAK